MSQDFKNQTSAKPISSTQSGKAIFSLVLGLLSFFCMFLTGIPAIILGFLGRSDIHRSDGRLQGTGLATAGIVLGCLGCLWTMASVALLLPAVQQVREVARTEISLNNLKQQSLALLNYETAYRAFPIVAFSPDSTVEVSSKLSWRVQILPFLGEMNLHEKFHHDEPWDSPHNIALLDQMPEVFEVPGSTLEPGHTMYLVPVTKYDQENNDPLNRTGGGPVGFTRDIRTRLGSIMDGTSNTIMIVEANPEAAVPWTKPEDLEFDPENPTQALGKVRSKCFLAAFFNGSATMVDLSPEEQVKWKFLRGDGNVPVGY